MIIYSFYVLNIDTLNCNMNCYVKNIFMKFQIHNIQKVGLFKSILEKKINNKFYILKYNMS